MGIDIFYVAKAVKKVNKSVDLHQKAYKQNMH